MHTSIDVEPCMQPDLRDRKITCAFPGKMAQLALVEPAEAEAADIDKLLVIDQQIDAAEDEGLHQRWLFGKELLARREGKLLPRGLLDELVEATGKSRSELQYRMQFAQKYSTEEQLSNAIGQFKSWYRIVNEALPESNHRAMGTGENEWYTPQQYIEAARTVMGGIDLDPATSTKVQERIQAGKFLTKRQNGLGQKWSGNVWLNPPYSQPDIDLFVKKMVKEVKAGHVSQAIMLTHNYTDTSWFHLAESCAALVCFTRGRIKFVDAEDNECAPTQGQAFFYYGKNEVAFRKSFAAFGFIR
jgi:phage N-6-adenine-methyltransferase